MCYSILIENNLRKLEDIFHAKADLAAFERYNHMVERNSKKYKRIPDNPRIYPLYFAPVLVKDQGKDKIIPMRYRVRPNGTHNEVPNKYNVFNARLDSIQTRQTWRKLFTKNHGIVCVKGFYEWVKDHEGNKKVVVFSPKDDSYIFTPTLYDIWIAPDKSEAFASFAVITTDPSEEILAAGHDRSPINLRKQDIQTWLGSKSIQQSLEILNNPKAIFYNHKDSCP